MIFNHWHMTEIQIINEQILFILFLTNQYPSDFSIIITFIILSLTNCPVMVTKSPIPTTEFSWMKLFNTSNNADFLSINNLLFLL